MFDLVPDTLTIGLGVAVPVYRVYQVIACRSPGILTQNEEFRFLAKYFSFALALRQMENVFFFVPYLIPFYSWFRLGFHVYLYNFDGTSRLYDCYVFPFFKQHENQIESFGRDVHAYAEKVLPMDRIRAGWEFFKAKFSGDSSTPPPPGYTPSTNPAQKMPIDPTNIDFLVKGIGSFVTGFYSTIASNGPASGSPRQTARDLSSLSSDVTSKIPDHEGNGSPSSDRTSTVFPPANLRMPSFDGANATGWKMAGPDQNLRERQ